MIPLLSNTAIGYAIVMAVVLLAVVAYTIVRLRKQVNKRKDEEKKKGRNKL